MINYYKCNCFDVVFVYAQLIFYVARRQTKKVTNMNSQGLCNGRVLRGAVSVYNL